MSHIPSSFFKPSPVIPGLFIVIPGLIRDLLLAPHEMLNQVQHDSLEKPVILQKVVIPGLFIVIPGLIRDLLLAPHEMLNQVQHDSCKKNVILNLFQGLNSTVKYSKTGISICTWISIPNLQKVRKVYAKKNKIRK